MGHKTPTSGSTTTSSGDTCAYGPPVLDVNGRAHFSGYSWNLNRDLAKPYALEQSLDATLRRHRFETRSGDTWSGDLGSTPRNRAEYGCTTKLQNGQAVVFSHALRVHAGAPVTNWNVLGQFHHTPDAGEGHSPPFSFNLIPGEKLRVVKRTDPNPLTAVEIPPTVLCEKGLARERWYELVGRIVWGWENNGACEVWMDGAKIVDLPVTNIGFNDLVGPYWKFGIYRAEAAETLVAEYANVEIGGEELLARIAAPLPLLLAA